MPPSALVLSPAQPPPGLPDLAQQPARVQQCIALILRHAEEICAYPTGVVELHFNDDSVKGKLVQMWPTRNPLANP